MKRFKRWIVTRRQVRICKMLDRMNDDMIKAGFTRPQRRQFWRGVIAGRVDRNLKLEVPS